MEEKLKKKSEGEANRNWQHLIL